MKLDSKKVGHVAVLTLLKKLQKIGNLWRIYPQEYLKSRLLQELSQKDNGMIYLISRSPRRILLLKRYGYPFKVLDSDSSEKNPPYGEKDIPLHNAMKKLEGVRDIPKEGILLAADTIIWLEGKILGKPRDKKEASIHLKLLSGKTHSVVTGVSMLNISTGKKINFFEETLVTFQRLTEHEIDWLISSYEDLDKAGSYAIQGKAGLFVKKIEGCYMNVVGLPLPRIYPILKEWGVHPLF